MVPKAYPGSEKIDSIRVKQASARTLALWAGRSRTLPTANCCKTKYTILLPEYYNEDDTYKIQKQGYVFGQFSRFIRPGYQRIANTNPFPQLGEGVTEPIDKSVTLGVSAYTNATGNRLVVVAINDSADTETIDLTINNTDGSIQKLDAWRTSATENMEPIHPVSVADDVARLNLPPYSITTYVGGN